MQWDYFLFDFEIESYGEIKFQLGPAVLIQKDLKFKKLQEYCIRLRVRTLL